VRFEDREDHGDLYTPSLGEISGQVQFGKQRLSHKGPLIAEVQHRWKLTQPKGERSAASGSLDVSFRVTAESPLVEVSVRGTNEAKNHRLRIGLATGIPRGVAPVTVVADAAFGPVARETIVIDAQDAVMETAPPTAPLHRYVSVFSAQRGTTVYSDGLAEYEVDGEGIVWITLVRAVGDLSRNDLPERPGHAGWPEDVPGAQCIGPFEARFAILLHGARTPAVVDEIEHEAERFLQPLNGVTIRSALGIPARTSGPELAGLGLAFSAVKESEDGEWLVLRCVNLLDREQTGRWTLPQAIKKASFARLDETPLASVPIIALESGHSAVEFIAAPRAVVTLLVC
jgi:2-O-(6-phospho-alpha-D-mannosyl)-D-glycerate hydrolase